MLLQLAAAFIASAGTISSAGAYTAPVTIPGSARVIVRSAGKADTARVLFTAGGGLAGIPFGHFREPAFGPLRTGGYEVAIQGGVANLPKAKAAGARVFLNITGSGICAMEGGRFSVARWELCFRTYAIRDSATIVAYGDTGTIAGNYILDEPNHPTRWGICPGGCITPAMIEYMAAVSKSLFPRIPTVVRAGPDWLRPGRPYVALDGTWAQYAARRGPILPWRDLQVAGARELGLFLVLGLNVTDGGPTNPSDPLFEGFQGSVENGKQFYAMGPRALDAYGPPLVGSACAVILWTYRSEYALHAEIKPRLDNLGRLASAQSARPCRRAA